ncbi:MAG: DUF2270 domain-containing protein [Ardenticatenales bacterium]|nr:DUF2270 domain-containing protein [Ardenticatenales bacterium]
MAEPVGPPDNRGPDQIWSFRGYRLAPGEFNNAMIHFYRGEMTRSNVWRSRLDATTNWAVVATGAALSFAFSEASHSHFMIPINTLLITLFLYIEARRYRYYELWAYRVRLMETDFFAAMLAPPFSPSDTWATRLVDNLLHPTYTISYWEAFGRRFRRNYQFIFALLAIAWFTKIMIHPTPAMSVQQFIDHAAVGAIPGRVIIAMGMVFNTAIFVVGWLTTGLRQSQGEILPSSALGASLFQTASDMITGHSFSWSRHEQLAYIITTSKAKAEVISERILTTMSRGVTAVNGVGMYSKEERVILLVAIHPEQVVPLKKLVRDLDPKAFIIIHGTEEVIGHGFRKVPN